jgi:HSP20 family protein
MRYEPLMMLRDINREMNRLMGVRQQEQANPIHNWVPPVDIREEQDRFCLSLDLPGVEPKTIQVSMEQGVLEVSGERKAPETDAAKRYHTQERVQGTFKRRFKLPEIADDSEISAKSEHGVLQIVIKKRAEQVPRRIPITH